MTLTTKHLQLFLASVFFILGGWCVIAPMSVVALCIRPEFHSTSPLVPILVGCFGSQALISGLFAGFAKFTRATFLAYGIGLLPFFGFDAYFYLVRPVLTEFGMVDLVGNIIMLGICIYGWRAADA